MIHVDVGDTVVKTLCGMRRFGTKNDYFWWPAERLQYMRKDICKSITCPTCKRIVYSVKHGVPLETAKRKARS